MKRNGRFLRWGGGVLWGIAAAIFALFAASERAVCRAQEPTSDFGAPFFSLDGIGAGTDNIGSFGDFGNIGEIGGSDAAAPLAVAAKISRGSDGARNDEFWRDAVSRGGKSEVIGFLTIKTTVATGWHIYSPTQGAGGTPTTFALFGGSDVAALEIGGVRLATPFQRVEFFGDSLEELTGSVDWIAPIFRVETAENADGTSDSDFLRGLKISGTVEALACSEGDGASCVPQKIDFSAAFDPAFDPASIFDAAKTLAEAAKSPRDVRRPQAPPSADSASVEAASSGASEAETVAETRFSSQNWLVLLISAFLGGLILNATPCVLPVIGLKILSFFESAGRGRRKAFLLNVWYSLGVSIVFGALAVASVGLSFLFTRALFQIVMSVVVFAMALSLIGVWELQAPAFLGGQKSNELISKEGAVGATFKGIITTLLAIPCGAPLLSPVLDWASETTRRGEIGLVVVVYLTIGIGMSSPFLIAGAFPELLKFFPKPGVWTETFRKTMGFFLLGAVVWILYSAPLEFLLPTTAFLFALWFACWNIGRNQFEFDAAKRKAVGWVVSLLVLSVVGVFSFDFPRNPVGDFNLQSASEKKLERWAVRAARSGRIEGIGTVGASARNGKGRPRWAFFDQATLDAELAKGNPVAVDFTADWCMNCKFLEKTILHTEEAAAAFDARNVVTLTADWTNQNADSPDILEINALLDANGARQVPTLMIFSPKNSEKPIVLRGLYTKRALFDALETLDAPVRSAETSKSSTSVE